ncbi:hypothetical protein BDA96_04G073500 [Sorghum bicolor]|uniref:Uncharacterized protein n=2 Tax=Sorghum bicolor TaxID=4558 RepID=A0A921R298_SORBI|nr:uncharacterized protein LOC8077636 [Sorghum bicolor]KAG0532039.1 hypothetical protein BDA96_04G073500 [Sorghum bicolor]KXG29637.1 hypothetical protein SORBI_3004G068000 [Sorghum bicolor]|eukprot:XP_021315481.1 uncharacterized protein LOC8077636 [Sorghum bicolor]
MSSSPPPCSKTAAGHAPARYCLCAPTTHPGSFRCRLHRSSSSMDATAAASEEAKEAAAAAARAFLERMTTARKPRRQGVSGTIFLPGPSRLGATATADE